MPVVVDEAALGGVPAGKIVRSDKDQLLISTMDYVFIALAKGQAFAKGSRMAVVRPAQRVVHPQTRKPLGRILLTLGVLEVVEAGGGNTLKARVTYACGEMALGDLAQPYQIPPYPAGKETVPATRQAQGMIVASLQGEQLLGAYSLVFADLGAAQGAMLGDVLTVIRPSPPFVEGSARTGPIYSITPEVLGEGVIVRVGHEASTVVLTKTGKETATGDVVFLSGQVKP
jgi:hypothetical protein